MAFMKKQGFLFVLAALSLALIARAEALGTLSVPFIQNQGQIDDPQVLFYARTFGGTVFVTSEGQLVYALPGAGEEGLKRTVDRGPWTMNGSQPTAHSPQSIAIPNLAIIRETLVDADLAALPSGAERSGAIINSFVGNDSRRWQANIPAFNGVRFGDIYEGISLEVRATGDNVEKIFTVAPGADPARIALCLAGAESVRITSSGELEARTTLGPVRFTAPVAYQVNAAGERQSVSVAYALEGGQVGFCVGAFDAARPLVIDPLLASTFIGGTSTNVIRAMAVDSETNVLVAGYTSSTDFPATNNYNGAPCDGFIAKFDPQLTNLLAATYLGGSDEDAIMALVIDPAGGGIYVAGYTASRNFPMVNATSSNYNGGAYDAFVSLFDGNLSVLTKSIYLGGTNVDKACALALNAAGELYAAGYTASTNFPVSSGAFQTTLAGSNDAFVTKLSVLNFASTFVGGSSNDQAFGLTIDTNNFVYLAGVTASTNFPVTNGYQMVCRGASDAFVAKLSSALTNVMVATYLGGTNNEAANGIAVAPYTNMVCVVGYTDSGNFPRNPTNVIAPGYANLHGGGKDAFLTKLNLTLTNLLSSTYLGGAGDDEATAVLASATTNSLRIYITGHTTSPNFPVLASAYDTAFNGGRDAFVSCWSTANTLQASTYLGGSTNDAAYAMALQADRSSLFVAGVTASTNFPATLSAYNDNRAGQTNDDGFVTKFDAGLAYGALKWQVALTNMVGAPSLGWDGNIYCAASSNLYSFDAQGHQRWQRQAEGLLVNNSLGELLGLGCTPAIATNGTIYVTTKTGALQAISPAGDTNWTFNGSGMAFESSPAIGGDGTIYFGTDNNNIYAVRDYGSNKVCLWTNTLNSSVYASPVVATNGTIIVASANPAKLYILNQTNGTELRSWSMANITYSASPAIGLNGRVYIGNGNQMLCFDPASAPGSYTQSWATAGPVSVAPTIGFNGMIYVGGGSNLYEFNPNGSAGSVWVTDGAIKSSPAIDSDGSIIVGSYNTGLYSFNPNGSTNWVFACNDFVFYSSPLIRRDGTVYMTDAMNLYAIFAPAPTARTNWPIARHDVLRTGNAAFDAARILKPTGLTASQGDYLDHVAVNWNGDPNAEYYELWRGTNTFDTAALFKTLLTTNCTDTNIAPGMIYYYWVRVATPVAMSDFSDSAFGGVPPLPPTDVTASKGNPTNYIAVAWSNSVNATMYYVYRSSVTNDTNTAGQVWQTSTGTYADTNIARGLSYYYWVKAGNGPVGISDFSAGDGVANRGGTPPLAPASITASTNSSLGVNVSWGASTGATMYVVYRNTTTNIPAGFLVITNGMNLADTTVEALQVYYYWVRATNQYGMGEFSAYTNGWRLLNAPLAVNATKGMFVNQISVSWQAEAAAASYCIWRNMTNDGATASNIAEIASSWTNYDDSNIARGAGYYYWVQSKNAYGVSALSAGDGVANLGGTAPIPPLNVSASDGTDAAQVDVTWASVNFASVFEVYRQDSYVPPSPLAMPLAIVSGTNYADTLAHSGQRYYYWVKSTNQFGRSELSGFNSGWRPLTTPYAVSATAGLTNLTVAWSSADNAVTYELWRGTNSDLNAALMLINAVPTNYCDDVESVPGVLYYYWVRAKTLQFIGEFSSNASGWRVEAAVDIGVSDLVFLPTRMAVLGTPAAVSFRVTNYGQRDMVAPDAGVAYNFYISSNSVCGDADDIWMGGTNMSIPLAVSKSTVVVLPKSIRDSITVPVVLPGLYNIFVDIQHMPPTKWTDPNLANNTIGRNGGVIRIGATQPAGLVLINDYDGDGSTDLAMYQEATGTWKTWLSAGHYAMTQATGLGGAGFMAVPGDYDGDGKTDLAVYQEATGTWKVWLSAGDYAMAQATGLGGPGFEPVPGDYDGDGRTDLAVYQAAPSTSSGQGGNWRIWLSGAGYALAAAQGKGGAGFHPVPGDYDGDAKADLAVYQEATGTWWTWWSTLNYGLVTGVGMGGAGYQPVPADYDCDGIMDPAVCQASTGSWKVWLSSSGYSEVTAQGLGGVGMVAVPGDFDGDCIADPAMYWDAFGMWRLWLSGSGYQLSEILAWPGGDGYQPVWNN